MSLEAMKRSLALIYGGYKGCVKDAANELRCAIEEAEKEREAPPKAQPMTEALLDKKANTGPIYAPGGIVSRTPVSYRVELQNYFKAGFRAAERHHKITGE